jgi:hypothetical protein
MSDKFYLESTRLLTDNNLMKKLKENDIYPKFEFRLSREDKTWLMAELKELKMKFNDSEDDPVVTKNTLLVAALRYGIRALKSQEKISANE